MKFTSDHIQVIDEALDQFEREWCRDHHGLIERLAKDANAKGHADLVLELVRSDIGRRYSVGLPVNLRTYVERFPQVFCDSDRLGLICYEDFRTRQHRGLLCSPERWAGLVLAASQPWYAELMADSLASCGSSAAADLKEAETPVTSSGLLQEESVSERSGVLRMGDFELVALLGEGTFSRVYLARQLSLGSRYVALKVVSCPFREPSHLARLHHTGIVPLYSCHYAEGKWLLCMPYSGPTTLADWMKKADLPSARSGKSLVETLQAAQAGVTVLHQPDSLAGSESAQGGELESLRKWHEASSEPLREL